MADNTDDQHSLACIPDDISVCFLSNAENLSQRSLQRGLNYFTQGYIHQIRVSRGENSVVRVDAKCWRSMQKSQRPHQLQIEISASAKQIKESFCSCKAGISGECSHIIGLIKSLQGLKLHNFTNIPDQQSCTSIPQQWHIPRGQKIQPVPINHVVVAKPSETRKRKPVICHFDVNYRLPEIKAADLSPLQNLTGTPLANLSTNTPTVNTPVGNVQLGSILSYQTRNIKTNKPTQQQRCGDLLVHRTALAQLPAKYKCLNTLDENFDVKELEVKTRNQSDSPMWHMSRSERLTSSNFGKVMKRKSPPTNAFMRSIFPATSIRAAPLEYGKRHESNAKAKYLMEFPQRHLHECGFVINREFDFLGASPDGKVCDNGESGLIEVKCPYRARDLTVLEACEQFKDFFMELGSDKTPKLRKDHEYYAQVQGQLMVTGNPFCDFIVFTKRDLQVERIIPDLKFMDHMLPKLAEFYQSYVVPYFNSQNIS